MEPYDTQEEVFCPYCDSEYDDNGCSCCRYDADDCRPPEHIVDHWEELND